MEFWPFLVLGPIVGFALYAIHRSTIQPLMYKLCQGANAKTMRRLRWTLRYGSNEDKKAIMRELDGWSALTDYLYTSAGALVAATVLLRSTGEAHPHDKPVWIASLILLFFAFVGDYQVIKAEEDLLP